MSRICTPRIFVAGVACLSGLLAGCERFPRDPQGTLERVNERDTLSVGAFDNPPWVTLGPDDSVSGPEADLIEGFADDLGVEVEWFTEGAEDVFEALEKHDLDVAIGGITQENPWSKRLGFSIPYTTETVQQEGETTQKHHVMAVTKGENAMLMRLEDYLLAHQNKIAATGEEVQP